MILAADTDVLVSWAMEQAPGHAAVQRMLGQLLRTGQFYLGLTPQVLWEFLHVVTDSRRFEHPMSMVEGQTFVATLWRAREVAQILPKAATVERSLQLLTAYGLGRKRILDTTLAATLQAAGVRHLATLNARDFAIFPFLELVVPS